jgi:hypothetical protein
MASDLFFFRTGDDIDSDDIEHANQMSILCNYFNKGRTQTIRYISIYCFG